MESLQQPLRFVNRLLMLNSSQICCPSIQQTIITPNLKKHQRRATSNIKKTRPKLESINQRLNTISHIEKANNFNQNIENSTMRLKTLPQNHQQNQQQEVIQHSFNVPHFQTNTVVNFPSSLQESCINSNPKKSILIREFQKSCRRSVEPQNSKLSPLPKNNIVNSIISNRNTKLSNKNISFSTPKNVSTRHSRSVDIQSIKNPRTFTQNKNIASQFKSNRPANQTISTSKNYTNFQIQKRKSLYLQQFKCKIQDQIKNINQTLKNIGKGSITSRSSSRTIQVNLSKCSLTPSVSRFKKSTIKRNEPQKQTSYDVELSKVKQKSKSLQRSFINHVKEDKKTQPIKLLKENVTFGEFKKKELLTTRIAKHF